MRQAVTEELEGMVVANVALRVGQVIWYVGTYPFRLVLRGLDVL